MDTSPFDSIPDIPTLERRFNFIESENVRQNVTVCFQYIIFLTVTNEIYGRRGAIELSLYRDIVVHTASIIESCLHYAITKLVADGKIDKDKLDKAWEVTNHALIHKVSDDFQIISAHKKRGTKIYKDNPSSKDINAAARAINLLDKTLFEKAEHIREARNDIHIIGENKTIAYPTKTEVDAMFDDARNILAKIELSLLPF